MLSTTNCINVEIGNYGFNGSPESSSDDSFISDYFDNASPSDEDFIQQLSADLDIPLLLNPDEEGMSLLNSFLDRSPGEILSEIKSECSESDFKHTKNDQQFDLNYSFIKQEMPKFERDEIEVADVKVQNINVLSSKVKSAPKRVAHNPYVVPLTKTKNNTPLGVANILPQSIVNNSNNLIVFDSIPTISTNAINLKPLISTSNPASPPSCISSIASQSPVVVHKVENLLNFVPLNCSQVLDERALKRQQRMIKNRESACLSRKKKRDYVTSLENVIQLLTDENERLKVENKELRDQLSARTTLFSLPSKTVTKTLTVCAVFCVMGFNINYLHNPLNNRNGLSALNGEPLLPRDHHGRSLLWAQDFPPDNLSTFNNPNKSKSDVVDLPVCPFHLNQSENVRLVLELHRLIGKPYNISEDILKNVEFDENKSKLKKWKPSRFRHRIDPLVPSLYKMHKKNRKLAYSSTGNELQVLHPHKYPSYPEFFEAINRQDDTFYLVSLSSDHLLLPALNHNKTSRPKMSLLLPLFMQNLSSSQTTIPLMQIDCEVLDTRLLHVNYGSIPLHLRTQTNFSRPSYENKAHHEETPRDTLYDSYKPYVIQKAQARFKNTTKDYKIINQHGGGRGL